MSKQEKEIKALLAKLEEVKVSNSPEARAIRKRLRSLGYYLSKGGEGKKSKEGKDEDEEKVTKKSKKSKRSRDEDEEDEDKGDEDKD